MRKNGRANKGQFFVIAALLVSVVLVGGVISTYSLVRHPSVAESPDVLGAIGEMNDDIKSVLDFTVGYYGSILQVTGNATYAEGLTNTYLSSGLVNIARSHPEWNPSFTLNSKDVSTKWFMPESKSSGDISVTYSLGALGIEGVKYETSSSLTVEMLTAEAGQARIEVIRDNSDPELGLTTSNFWFYNYSYAESKWELVNPSSIIISSNGVYTIPLPNGVGPESYSVQIEDNRGLVVSAFYSQACVASESRIPHYTYTFDWESTGVLDIYDSLSTDDFVIELLQNGTMKWLGHSLDITPKALPLPPVSVKAFRVNATTTSGNQQIPFQVEDWSADYKVPLGLSGNESLFTSTNMLVFLVNNDVEKITLWWDGNDTAIPTPFAHQKNIVGIIPDTDHISLSNGRIGFNVDIDDWSGELSVTSTAGSVNGEAEFLQINGVTAKYWASTSVVACNCSVRAIFQQEPEFGSGAATNMYAQLIFTLPVNTNYYTYTTRIICVEFDHPTLHRTIDELSVVQLSASTWSPLTENGTLAGYPVPDTDEGTFYEQSSESRDHHWSEFLSGSSGTGVMFRDVDTNLYNFNDIFSCNTATLVVDDSSRTIEVNPVDVGSVTFDNPLDASWHGAVATFTSEPIHPSSGQNGLWVMVENPPTISMDEPILGLDFVDRLSEDVDSSPDKGSHSDFNAQKSGPDTNYDKLTEVMTGGENTQDYVDTTSDSHAPSDIGSHSSFSAMQTAPDSVYDTLTEENTAGSGDSTLLDDGFEGEPWNVNWNDIPSNWDDDNYPTHGGSATSAWATDGREGYFISDNLDASDATAIHVDFWFMKDDIEPGEFVLYYYNGNNYVQIDDLDNNGYDDDWIHFTATITESQYFVSNFRIRFYANINDWRENVWVDDVLITKEVSTSDNYELDLEVQWTGVDDTLPNEYLAIYGGTMGVEDIVVDVWTISGWEEDVFNGGLSSGWNNVSVSSWLTDSTFTIRFRGVNDVGDSTLDTWEIDAVLLHTWNDEINCEIDLEVQWTHADHDETNEELCIYVGEVASEDLRVDVWTGSEWEEDLFNGGLNVGWNNKTVSSYLISEEFTIRFVGTAETGDTTQDYWTIDAVLLHTWS